ncbi:protein of unknown function DUF115 [Spirochaeta thermophila DSM 6578]|uniref:DUF115 domain-containing protein n=1 Tax=Winmispira thermophila (strain ATCC 700085 / DSM 6578 / Z-1203) TaxID=869211 RepID=G0GAQ4_WINT7|nr:6-hydroxymethylpterin diphosphokinase MptE-like protein [Spirochaeta thermophila]AEJ61019.1 protein of unknown function DUF115 [Spirochaeta thermophila DSM 6578]
MNTTLARNLQVLTPKDPSLARLIAHTSPHPGLTLAHTPHGETIPALTTPTGIRTLHSRIDPDREAQRLIKAQRPKGFCIVLGLGAGYHLKILLHTPEVHHILVLEHDPSFLAALLSLVDLSDILSHPRIHLLLDPSPDLLSRTISRLFIPSLDHTYTIIPLRSRTLLAPTAFDHLLTTTRTILDTLSSDHATQTRFGTTWMRNTLLNLPHLMRNTTIPPLPPRLAITGAGPSLIHTIPLLRNHPVLASDTSLPVLLHHDITPFLVTSIDCQPYTLLHYAGLPSTRYPVLLDLAAPPPLVRTLPAPLLAAGPHPLHQYLAAHLPLPHIPSHTGNVAATLTLFALSHGAREILLAGTDFAYPHLLPYPPGTFLWPYLLSRTTHTSPLLSGLLSLTLPRIHGDHTPPTSPLLSHYRTTLLAHLEKAGGTVVEYRPGTFHISAPETPPETIPSRPPTLEDLSRTMTTYRNSLEDLPPLASRLQFDTLPDEARALWATLLPLLASTQRRTLSAPLEEASRQTLTTALRLLDHLSLTTLT